jgi:hypothetical protein
MRDAERLDEMAAWCAQAHGWLRRATTGPCIKLNPDDLAALVAGLGGIAGELARMGRPRHRGPARLH